MLKLLSGWMKSPLALAAPSLIMSSRWWLHTYSDDSKSQSLSLAAGRSFIETGSVWGGKNQNLKTRNYFIILPTHAIPTFHSILVLDSIYRCSGEAADSFSSTDNMCDIIWRLSQRLQDFISSSFDFQSFSAISNAMRAKTFQSFTFHGCLVTC